MTKPAPTSGENITADQPPAIVAHTPGPWTVGYKSWDVRADNDKGKFKSIEIICDMRQWDYLAGKKQGPIVLPPENEVAIQEANARLIAAAPDMLAAMKAVEEWWLGEEMGHHTGAPYAIFAICAAIAKAEGRAS